MGETANLDSSANLDHDFFRLALVLAVVMMAVDPVMDRSISTCGWWPCLVIRGQAILCYLLLLMNASGYFKVPVSM